MTRSLGLCPKMGLEVSALSMILALGLLNRYIYSKEDEIHVDANGDDSKLWYFNAPKKFLGNFIHAYGESLNLLWAPKVVIFLKPTSIKEAIFLSLFWTVQLVTKDLVCGSLSIWDLISHSMVKRRNTVYH